MTTLLSPNAQTSRAAHSPTQIMIVDVDGATLQQHTLRDRYNPTIVPLGDRKHQLRYWMTHETIDWLRGQIRRHRDPNALTVSISGSNDYHHMAYVWAGLFNEPFTILCFDAHSDLFRNVPGYVWNGGWVSACFKRLPMVQKIISLGVDKDLNGDMKQHYGLPDGVLCYEMNWLTDGKFEMYPNTMQRSSFQGRLRADLPSVKLRPNGLFSTEAHWQPLRSFSSVEAALVQILSRVPTDKVFITVDKDVLREEDAFTVVYGNHMQSTLTLDELVQALAVIRTHKQVLGVDIIGDFSYPALPKLNKARRASGEMIVNKMAPEAIDSIDLRLMNERTNLRIIETFAG